MAVGNGISWDELNKITDSFSKYNLIEETNWFQLFRGKMSTEVTVKIWNHSISFSEKYRMMEEERLFLAKAEASKCSNVVNVVGYCCEGEHCAAIYKLKSVSTLETYLVEDEFQWRDRMIVALGIGRLIHFFECAGYTHLIHSALPHCVILDQEMTPILYDIGVLTGRATQLSEGPVDSSTSSLTRSSNEGGSEGIEDSSTSSLTRSSNEGSSEGTEDSSTGSLTLSSNEDVWTKTDSIVLFGILLLRLICREGLYQHMMARYFTVTLPLLSEKAWPTFRKIASQRFFYKCDYDQVYRIAWSCFASKKDRLPISEMVQRLECLFLLSLPARKSLEKVVTRGSTLIYFSYENLCELTGSFCEENLFAQTQLGEAYRGKIQQGWKEMEAQDVIVKMWGNVNFLSFEVMQSSMEDNIYRLRDEVFLLTQKWIIDHPNSVKLLGYCFDDKKVGAVYSHKPLDTLQNLLDDDKLSWRDRAMIALELARFLEVLHGQEPQCVVRNISAVHIMIDQGDLHPGMRTANNTKLLGFTGYLDPYFLKTGSVVPQSDIYAFGILLMSLICKCDMAAKIQKFIFTFVEEEYKSKYSLAHESFADDPSFDQYDGHKLSELAMQCLGLDYPMSRPSASDIVKQLSNLSLFSDTHISADVDVEPKIWSSDVTKKKPYWTKFRRIFNRLSSSASGKQKEEGPKKGLSSGQKQREGPRIIRPLVVKAGCLTPELQRLGYIDEVTLWDAKEEEERKETEKYNRASELLKVKRLLFSTQGGHKKEQRKAKEESNCFLEPFCAEKLLCAS